jgi:hypothetical protein
MATGTLSSQSNSQLGVLRSGEKLASTMHAVGNKAGKTYYHRVPGARTHMPDGLEIQFLGGVFVTDDPDVIHELDKVADRMGSGVFTQRNGPDQQRKLEASVATEAADTAGTLGNSK